MLLVQDVFIVPYIYMQDLSNVVVKQEINVDPLVPYW